MKIYKWVPVANSENKKSKHKDSNKENVGRKSATVESSNSSFSMVTEDSNTCKFKLSALCVSFVNCF